LRSHDEQNIPFSHLFAGFNSGLLFSHGHHASNY